MSWQIVPTAESHLDGFHAVVTAVARERKYLDLTEPPPLETFRKFMVAALAKNIPHYVALSGDSVVGWCEIQRLSPALRAHAGVLGMGVVDDCRGQGIGEALITAGLNRARESGLTRVDLMVFKNNIRAQRLYEKMGFIVEGVKRNGIRDGDRYEDLICMGLLFE